MTMKGNLSGERVEAGSDDIPEGFAGAIRATKQRALHVNLRDNDGTEIGSGSGLPVSGTVAIDQTTDGTTNGVSVTNATIEQTTAATHNNLNLCVAGMNPGGEVEPLPVDSGKVPVDITEFYICDTDSVTVQASALPTGAATSAKQDTIIGHVDGVETLLGTIDGDTSALAGCVGGSAMQVDVLTIPGIVGTVADDATTPGAPVMIGGKAVETDGTDPGSVSAEDDVAIARTDRQRRLLVNDVCPYHWSVSVDYAAAQTNASVKAAPGASLKLYVTDIFLSNGATAGNVTLLDGSGGTVKFEAYVAINGGAVLNLRTPMVLTANTALCITSTTVTTHAVMVCGYTAP